MFFSNIYYSDRNKKKQENKTNQIKTKKEKYIVVILTISIKKEKWQVVY